MAIVEALSYHPKFKAETKAYSKQVVYFPGCYSTYNDAQTAKAVVMVLAHNGFAVITPNFRCCRVPLQSNDQFAQAETNAQHNLRLLRPYLEQGIPVVASCPSCTLTLKQDYAKLSSAGAELIASRTYDLFEFLWKKTSFSKISGRSLTPWATMLLVISKPKGSGIRLSAYFA